MREANEIVDILLADDNVDDVEIARRALKKAKLINRLHVVSDGVEVCDYLFRRGAYSDPESSPRPGLILLDINMPRRNGIEALQEIKKEPELRRIPVVMLTVSRRDEDILHSYDIGCNSFIQKPVDFDKFVEVVRQLGLYWGLINVPCPKQH